ncbi:MAG: hypothetical protein WCP96_08460 [Methylococcaceae bacterium]
MNGVWGTITRLADEYGISRTFIYALANKLKKVGQLLFEESTVATHAPSLREQALERMLSLRLECASSIGATSTVMTRFGLELSSTGSISQSLSQIGGLLPMTVSTEPGIIQYLVFASDEIFSKNFPILITVDPCSSAILRMELADSRNADDWKNHFECLMGNGLKTMYLVFDDGIGSVQAMPRPWAVCVKQTLIMRLPIDWEAGVIALKQPPTPRLKRNMRQQEN